MRIESSFRRRLTLSAAAVLLTAGAGVAATHAASAAAAGCQVGYTVTSQWQGGFGASVSVRNLGDPINGWKLTWSFPAGQTITQLWNGTHTQSGSQVTVTNLSYNGGIPTGGSTEFGFNGSWNGSNPVPSSFALNGVTCTGGVTSPSPSPTPSPSASASASASPSPSPSPSPSASPSASPTPPSRPAIENNFPVTREGAYGTNRYTVFRPSNPAAVGRPMPVLVFGNGACAHTNGSEVVQALTFVAARGFVVVDTASVDGSPNGVQSGSPIPSLLTDGISWAERENARAGSPLYQRIDLSRVATAGHSCGGLEALIAGQDRRVKSVVSLDSGLFADGSFGYSRAELSKLHTPVMFLDGGPSDIAYDNTRANYDLTQVPAVLAEHPQAGHVGFITGSQMTDGMTAVVQFLDMTLNGNATARAYILGPSGLAARAPWTVRSKNF
ncbi:cellulose binding domain-containing protein [Microbispora sp. H13382]|uniref:cellulose binding domain-containing protein n=1 Tax=Microbispora sp. H13382 TaxID=2729112 RepID=UPI0016015A16|nr:cellulose binding domain-containing protein [Microbispora sp. H13382]